MGGDFIGSHLVKLSTGVDFVEAVIKSALGEKPDVKPADTEKVAAVRFILNHSDKEDINKYIDEHRDRVISYEMEDADGKTVTDSASRWGYCLTYFDDYESARKFVAQ